jgi:hypothetical protein
MPLGTRPWFGRNLWLKLYTSPGETLPVHTRSIPSTAWWIPEDQLPICEARFITFQRPFCTHLLLVANRAGSCSFLRPGLSWWPSERKVKKYSLTAFSIISQPYQIDLSFCDDNLAAVGKYGPDPGAWRFFLLQPSPKQTVAVCVQKSEGNIAIRLPSSMSWCLLPHQLWDDKTLAAG